MSAPHLAVNQLGDWKTEEGVIRVEEKHFGFVSGLRSPGPSVSAVFGSLGYEGVDEMTRA